jgi:hypothetical protein
VIDGLPLRLTEPPTVKAPPLTSASSVLSLTGSLFVDDTADPPTVTDTALPVASDTDGVPLRLTVPPTVSAPPPISASSAVSVTGNRLLEETADPPEVIETEPLVPPPPKLQGVTPVPDGQKMVTPGYRFVWSGAR